MIVTNSYKFSKFSDFWLFYVDEELETLEVLFRSELRQIVEWKKKTTTVDFVLSLAPKLLDFYGLPKKAC